MHSRNYIYITPDDQKKLKDCRILIGGCGLGSVIAECALRLGFGNFCIIDGDKVELSNLNRQNYTQHDIGNYKVNALYDRLIKINPKANIQAVPEFLTPSNISDYLLPTYSVAINTLDFTSDMPFVFDDICCKQNIPVLHPLNLGWGASVFVIKENNMELRKLHPNHKDFEIYLARHIINKLKKQNTLPDYLPTVLEEYNLVKHKYESPPQLSIGSWIVASICTSLLYKLFLGKQVKIFPNLYFKSV